MCVHIFLDPPDIRGGVPTILRGSKPRFCPFLDLGLFYLKNWPKISKFSLDILHNKKRSEIPGWGALMDHPVFSRTALNLQSIPKSEFDKYFPILIFEYLENH